MRSTHKAHQLISEFLSGGEVVIDATAGNGHDTLFLADLIGVSGTVYAFDVQQEAIENTQERLEKAGFLDRVIVNKMGHQEMGRIIPKKHHGTISVIMFNLGYLPGSDHSITTLRSTTVVAINQGLQFLAPSGIMTVVCYPGHDEGNYESKSVSEYLGRLDSERYSFEKYVNEEAKVSAPFLVVITKIESSQELPIVNLSS